MTMFTSLIIELICAYFGISSLNIYSILLLIPISFCVFPCASSLWEHLRAGEFYYYNDLVFDLAICLTFLTSLVLAFALPILASLPVSYFWPQVLASVANLFNACELWRIALVAPIMFCLLTVCALASGLAYGATYLAASLTSTFRNLVSEAMISLYANTVSLCCKSYHYLVLHDWIHAKHLDLSYSSISEKDLIALAKNKSLISVNLAGNQLSLESVKLFTSNKTLRAIDLSNNPCDAKPLEELLCSETAILFLNGVPLKRNINKQKIDTLTRLFMQGNRAGYTVHSTPHKMPLGIEAISKIVAYRENDPNLLSQDDAEERSMYTGTFFARPMKIYTMSETGQENLLPRLGS